MMGTKIRFFSNNHALTDGFSLSFHFANIPHTAHECQEGRAFWRRFNISYELRATSDKLIFSRMYL